MLRVEDLHTYYGQGHVLQGVNLEVPAGMSPAGRRIVSCALAWAMFRRGG